MSNNDNKILIAYYSRKGQNYVNGKITNLPIGINRGCWQKKNKFTGGDLLPK
jgi:hypothetical protein